MEWIENNQAIIVSATAIVALLVSCVSIFLTLRNLEMQRTHNKLSVKPIGKIRVGDYENELVVALENKGMGPLIVKKLQVNGGENPTDWPLYKHMPLGIVWNNFSRCKPGKVILPNERADLLVLKGDLSDSEFKKNRDRVRKSLGTLTISIEYSDIYDSITETEVEELDWFLRNL